MASDLRKKWGTIFMGDRETTPEELSAMQEPALREQRRRRQEEEYLVRVRAKAEARAREILSAAYAERQKILAQAKEDGDLQARQIAGEANVLREQAQAALAEAEADRTRAGAERAEAEAERARARALAEEAEHLRDNAQHEGFQKGMGQAGEELKEFRIDAARTLADVLLALERQGAALCAMWREELAGLAAAAVEAGTGWVLDAARGEVLRHLVFESLRLLEDRASVTVRVHPDDEELVGGMFKAARERVPELRQWIVEGDASLEPGSLVAESVSGSVEHLRRHYREMVDGVLTHLALPERPEEAAAAQDLHAAAEAGAARLAAYIPPPLPEPEPEPAPKPEPNSEPEPAEAADAETSAEAGPVGGGLPDEASEPLEPEAPPVGQDAETGLEDAKAAGALGIDPAVLASLPPDTIGEEPADPASAPAAPDAQAGDLALAPDADEPFPEPPPLPDDLLAAAQADAGAGAAASGPDGGLAAGGGPSDNPSLAELEDELFPLPGEADGPQGEVGRVLADGGFLPEPERKG